MKRRVFVCNFRQDVVDVQSLEWVLATARLAFTKLPELLYSAVPPSDQQRVAAQQCASLLRARADFVAEEAGRLERRGRFCTRDRDVEDTCRKFIRDAAGWLEQVAQSGAIVRVEELRVADITGGFIGDWSIVLGNAFPGNDVISGPDDVDE